MQLSQISLRHFRSLYDVTLTFKPLTILIGPNASGKSNLFKALRFLYDAVAGDRQDWQAYDAQIDDLLWYGYDETGQRPSQLEYRFKFCESRYQACAAYTAIVKAEDYLETLQERLELSLQEQNMALYPYFERDQSVIQQKTGHRGKPLSSPYRSLARSPRTLTLRDEGPSLRLPLAQAVYKHIRGWRFFDVDLNAARESSFVPEVPEDVPPLAGDASNLSAFLYALNLIQNDDFSTINIALSDFITLPQNVLVQHDAERGGQNARYGFVETPFGENRLIPPSNMSDGTIRLLAQLALLLGDHSVTLACLEEPDQGLHPHLMLHMADVLRQAVTPVEDEDGNLLPSPQVIVTTHSPEFMDCFDLEAEQEYLQVYVAERDEQGKTQYTPTSVQEFAPWLERYRLGEAVRRRFI